MIRAEEISQGYGPTTVLRSVTTEINAGVTGLLGPNGAGKTTLFKTLATVLPPTTGRLTIAGRAVSSEQDAREARRGIGYLPQGFPYDPSMELRDFLQYGAWLRGIPARKWRSACLDALEYVQLVPEARKRMGRLSGGMRQRAGIAWALVGRPPVVLLDEPTVGLDPEQRLRFRALLTGLNETAVLLSTHLTDDVDAVCDRVLVMNAGRLVYQGSILDLRSQAGEDAIGNTPIERAYMSLIEMKERSV